ncbi:putative outer protein E [Chlamydia ibidis]|uniref:Outer protein E n=2 Tax=Chlamydia ibidis TaxID=1405396 RepID=A0ABN0N0G2_9CHLA|nr:DUF5421 family protein [Chlamydia ibidis]EPP34626.1 putative outer protein E [Chlamydia ibidis]EQM63106.1 outer protein E [Chlamydia ibidis 10-1398/6]
MELNKTSESLYNCKAGTHSQQSIGPDPVDNRDVKVFSLEGKQQSRAERNDKLAAKGNRQDARSSSDDKRLEEGPASVVAKEEEEQEQENGFMICENAAAGMSLVDIATSMATEVALETAQVAVASVDLSWVADIVASTVDAMMVTDIGGQQLVEIVLDSEAAVPEAFAGANLTLVQSGDQLTVKFSNFTDNVQMSEAMQLVASNPVQLTNLVQSLKDRMLTLTELTIGTNAVQLPKLEEIRSPMHVLAASIRQQDQEKDQDGRQQHSDQEQDQKQFKVEEASL